LRAKVESLEAAQKMKSGAQGKEVEKVKNEN